MPWTPLPRLAFAICTYPFTPLAGADLPLQIGDELYIIEEGGIDDEWFRGYLVAPPSLLAGLTSTRGQTLEKRVYTGVFPRVCVDIKELLGDVTEYVHTSEQSESLMEGGKETSFDNGSHPSPSGGQTTAGAVEVLHRKKANGNIPKANSPAGVSSLPASSSASTAESQDSSTNSPRKPLAPVPMLKIGDESAFAKDEPLVDEIASCLREWHSTKLHELLLNQEYGKLDEMSKLVTRLDSTRKQLFHKVLTETELDELRESAIWDLVSGNKMLDQDVVVRSAVRKGRILTSDDPATEISQQQAMMSLLERRPTIQTESRLPYHTYASIKSFTSSSDKQTTIALCLCAKHQGEPPKLLSEHYTVDATNQTPGTTINFDGLRRTLFTDISPSDIGDSASERSNVFLVVKMITSEPPARHVSKPSRAATPSTGGPNASSANVNATWRSASFKGGRQSLMWGRKGRKDFEGNVRSSSVRLDNSGTPSPTIKEEPKPETQMENTSKSKPFRKLTGLGILDVTTQIRSLAEVELSLPLQSLRQALQSSSHLTEDHSEVLKWLLGGEGESVTSYFTNAVLILQWKSFRDVSSDNLIQETPTFLHNITTSPRLGFVGAPSKTRSDIYLTLQKPTIRENALLSHPRLGSVPMSSDTNVANLQLTLEVRNAAGERIDHCIFPSSNSTGHTAWRTMAVESGEFWNQTIRLAIQPGDVPGAHIIMSLAEGYNFPFALCWMPLWLQDAFVRDSEHSLALYKYDETTSTMISGKGAYLSLPWNSRANDVSVTGHVATVQLSTFLCSTAYSQDPNLLGLLRWKDQEQEYLIILLKKFPFVPEIEIVKLLKDVFNALLGAVVEYAGHEELEDLVLNALVTVLSIVNDRRFNLQPLVDDYAENDFRFPFAFPCLVQSFTRLLNDPASSENSRRLRSTCKVGAYILKFIVKARQQQVQKEVGIGINSHGPTFAKDLQVIFTATAKLMQSLNPVLVGTKTLMVQNFHTWLPELSGVTSPDELLSLAIQFIDSCSDVQGRLILYELLLIKHITDGDLFSTEDAKDAWQKNVQRWLAPHWGTVEAKSPQYRDRVRLCCSVVSSIFATYGTDTSIWARKLIESYKAIQDLSRPLSDTFSPLFPSTYPFPTRPTTVNAAYDEALIEIVALCAATSSLPPTVYNHLSTENLEGLFMDMLHVSRSILNYEAFPPHWLSLHVFSHRSVLKTLRTMYEALLTKFLPLPDDATDFNDELWRSFLMTLLKLVASDALALETFPEQKRRAVWKIAGDIRETGAELLGRTWQSMGWETQPEEQAMYGLERMGGYQVSYIPGLVEPIMELCLSVHEGLRNVAIGVLHSMIVSEWTLNDDLAVIQTAMIDNLDQLYRSKPLNDGMLQKQFLAALRSRFDTLAESSDQGLYKAVIALLDTISELFDLLVAVYAPETSGDTTQILDTLRLLEYLKDMQKVDIYIGYVYRLAQIQQDSKNYTEAGLALKLHADLHDWDSNTQLPALDDLDLHYPAQSAFERKEQIYFQMIKYFEEALDWHQALAAYDDLATQYQSNMFDYSKLARSQRAMATIYERIGAGERQHSRYFRVTYRGLGFPSNLRDKQFIFQGLPHDKLSSFTDRMQQQFPAVHIVGGGPLDEIEGQYLAIYPISPHKDFTHPVNQRIKTAQPVKEHLMTRSPRRFANTTRRQAADSSGVKSHQQEKIVYTTAEAFPTITRRSEIITSETIRLTPVQIGLERTTRKSQELQTLTQAVADGGEAAMKALTENVMILVNTKSQGSVIDYWDLVADDNYESNWIDGQSDDESRATSRSLKEALRVVLVDHVLAIRRALECFSRGAYSATKAELTQGMLSRVPRTN